jgi:hypothetical protein
MNEGAMAVPNDVSHAATLPSVAPLSSKSPRGASTKHSACTSPAWARRTNETGVVMQQRAIMKVRDYLGTTLNMNLRHDISESYRPNIVIVIQEGSFSVQVCLI